MAAYSSSSVASPTPSTAPSVVWPSRRAVSSLDPGASRRATMSAVARSRWRLGRGSRSPSSPRRRRLPRTATTAPWGRLASALEPVGGEEPLAPQAAPDEIDQLGRQVAQVAHRLGLDLAVLAVRPAQQVGLVHLALVVPTRRRDMDGATSRAHTRIIAEPDPHVKYISAYARQPVGQASFVLRRGSVRAHGRARGRWNFGLGRLSA